MSRQSTVLSLFIASPSGLTEERESVSEIVELLNASAGKLANVVISIEKSELVVGQAGRAQEQLNGILKDSDIFIGLLHRTWGSETGSGHDSGFMEEYDNAISRWGASGSPNIYLFFKSVQGESIDDPGPKLKKVLDFKARIEASKEVYYNEFLTVDQFKQSLMQLLIVEIMKAGENTGVAGTLSTSLEPNIIERESSPTPASSQLSETLTQFASNIKNAKFGSELDRDRLTLFALASAIDEQNLPIPVANRLFLRREDLILIVLEMVTWLRAFILDVGGSDSASSRVMPMLCLFPDVGAFERFITTYWDKYLLSNNPVIRVGWLKLASVYKVKPVGIWTTPAADVDVTTSAIDFWDLVFQGTSARYAFDYWMNVAVSDDRGLALALSSSVNENTSKYGKAIIDLLEVSPSAESLADLIPDALSDSKVVEKFDDRGIYATISIDRLKAVMTNAKNSVDVRLGALNALIARNALPSDLIESILAEGSCYKASTSEWESRSCSELIDRPVGIDLIRQLVPIITEMQDSRKKRNFLSRLRASNSEFSSLLGPTPVVTVSDDDVELDDVDYCLSESLGTSVHAELARSLAFGTFPPANRYISKLAENIQYEELADYISMEFRFFGIIYLGNMPLADLTPADLTLIRQLAREEKNILYTYEIAQLLVRIGDSDDVDLLIGHLRMNMSESRASALTKILRLATDDKLNSLIESSIKGVAIHAFLELIARERAPSKEWIREAIYGSDKDLRLVVLDFACRDLDSTQLAEFLKKYVTHGDSYYYNVVAELDRRIGLHPKVMDLVSHD